MAEGRVLVTGGAGFIGRWVVARCLAAGHQVAVYDNVQVGRIANLEEVLPRIRLFQNDILDEAALNGAMAEMQPDLVIHLAAHHFIPFCNAHPIETLRVNVDGTYAVLQAAVKAGVPQAVVASSGVLYPGRDTPLNEDEPSSIIDVYGLSKLMCEQVCQYFADNTPLRCVVTRFFNTYGPFETNPHLIPHIMESIHAGPQVILGNIHTKRDYIYVEDVADLVLACSRIRDRKYAVVNIGTGEEHSAEEVMQTISRIMGREIGIVVDPARLRPVDKPHQIADIGRLISLTGARPAHSLEAGLRKLLQHEGLV